MNDYWKWRTNSTDPAQTQSGSWVKPRDSFLQLIPLLPLPNPYLWEKEDFTNCLCTSVRLKIPNNNDLHKGQCLWLIRLEQAKGLINTVSDKLISKAAKIHPLLVMGWEAASLSRNNYSWSDSTRIRSDKTLFISFFHSTRRTWDLITKWSQSNSWRGSHETKLWCVINKFGEGQWCSSFGVLFNSLSHKLSHSWGHRQQACLEQLSPMQTSAPRYTSLEVTQKCFLGTFKQHSKNVSQCCITL